MWGESAANPIRIFQPKAQNVLVHWVPWKVGLVPTMETNMNIFALFFQSKSKISDELTEKEENKDAGW